MNCHFDDLFVKKSVRDTMELPKHSLTESYVSACLR